MNVTACAGRRLRVVVSGLSSDAHLWNLVHLQLFLEDLGHEVANLGNTTPDATIVEACRTGRPDLLVLSTVNGHGRTDGLRLIRALRAVPSLAALPVVIGGKLGIDGRDHAGDAADGRRIRRGLRRRGRGRPRIGPGALRVLPRRPGGSTTPAGVPPQGPEPPDDAHRPVHRLRRPRPCRGAPRRPAAHGLRRTPPHARQACVPYGTRTPPPSAPSPWTATPAVTTTGPRAARCGTTPPGSTASRSSPTASPRCGPSSRTVRR